MGPPADPLARFQPAVRDWFLATFPAPTPPQALGWPVLARRESTLLLAPTGTGKTLAAFLACIDRLMFEPLPPRAQRCRVLYVSPLKALAVDVERNLRAPLLGIANVAAARGDPHLLPAIAVRTVRPLTSTACPDVAAARASARSPACPSRRSSSLRRR